MGEGRGYMFIIDTKTIVTPQNGLNIYRGRTENNIISMEPEITDIGVKPEADELLSGTLKKRKSKGMILVGKLLAVLAEYNEGTVSKALGKCISARHADMLDLNHKAMEIGRDYNE